MHIPTPFDRAHSDGREAFKLKISRLDFIESYRGDKLLKYAVMGWDKANEEYQSVLNKEKE